LYRGAKVFQVRFEAVKREEAAFSP